MQPAKNPQNRSFRILVLALAVALAGCASARHSGPPSDHFDGTRFFNPGPTADEKSFSDLLRFFRTRNPREWPEKVEVTPARPPDREDSATLLQFTFVGHSTVLLQTAGLNILTDPVWSERVSPVSWAGPKRVKAPGIRFEELPKIDLILLSHNHYDHFDIATLERIIARDHPQVLLPLGDRVLLAEKDLEANAVELDWWQSHRVSPQLEVTFTPARHWSSRGLFDRRKSLWGSFVLRTPHGQIYFAGDTGAGPHFAEVARRFGAFAFALIPIGAYEPEWFMSNYHINPDEAVAAHRELRSDFSLGIHWGTFRLSDEGIDDPPARLREAAQKAGLEPGAFVTVPAGGSAVIRLRKEIPNEDPSGHLR